MYDNLSYVLQKQTNRMIALHNGLRHNKFEPWIIGLVLSSVYFIAYIDRYMVIAFPGFASNEPSGNLIIRSLDLLMVVTLIICAIVTCVYSKRQRRITVEYLALKEKIMAKFDDEFCGCENACNCREEYLREMEEHGIRLWES